MSYKLSAEQIEENFNKHLSIIKKVLENKDRRELALNIVKTYKDEYVLAPASSKGWFHNAIPGGYVDHVNRVIKLALKLTDFYELEGGKVDYTREEITVAALFHDLGKLGYPKTPVYKPQTNNWRKDNLDEIYEINEDIEFMTIPDRSLFVLQLFDFRLSKKEYLGIKLHDGIFDEGNKPYFFSNRESSRMRTNIVNVLHTADFLASKIEYDLAKNS